MKLVARRPILSVLVSVFALAAHVGAALSFSTRAARSGLDSAYYSQFYVFLAGSAACVVAEYLAAKRLLFRLIAAAHAVFVLLLTVQIDVSQTAQYLVLVPFIFELAIYERFPHNLAVSLFVIALVLFREAFTGISSDSLPGDVVSEDGVFFLFATGFAVTASLMLRYRERMLEQESNAQRLDHAVSRLIEANIGFQDYANQIERKSIISERLRVSRDLHDIMGSTMTNVIMMVEAAQDHFRSGRVSELTKILRNVREQAEYGLEQTRSSLYALRSIPEAPATGLQSIHRLIKQFESVTNIRVHVEYGNVRWNVGANVNSLLYHVVQEGITNAFRHGKATRIRIVLVESDGIITVAIQDNGRGASEVIEGIGLTGMRERIAPHGGALHAKNITDGFELRVTLPLNGN